MKKRGQYACKILRFAKYFLYKENAREDCDTSGKESVVMDGRTDCPVVSDAELHRTTWDTAQGSFVRKAEGCLEAWSGLEATRPTQAIESSNREAGPRRGEDTCSVWSMAGRGGLLLLVGAGLGDRPAAPSPVTHVDTGSVFNIGALYVPAL